jgi:hypothetical protein
MITVAIAVTAATSITPKRFGASTSRRGFVTSETVSSAIATPTNTIFVARARRAVKTMSGRKSTMMIDGD